jgi:hypothetical protein
VWKNDALPTLRYGFEEGTQIHLRNSHSGKYGEKRMKDVRMKFDGGDRRLRAVTLDEMTLRRSSWDIRDRVGFDSFDFDKELNHML